jgi:hypothetical protein
VVKKELDETSSHKSNLQENEYTTNIYKEKHIPRLIPVDCSIVQIKLNNWPDLINCIGGVPTGDKPVSILD